MGSKKEYCADIYGERLNIGDEVIPVVNEALIFNRGGIISKIEYSKRYNDYFITIIDKEGKVLLDSISASYYTTKKRFEEREKNEYAYKLVFLDEKFIVRSWTPLTDKTDSNYEIPKDTKVVVLWTNYLTEKNEYSKTHRGEEIYCCFFEDGINLCLDPKINKYDFDMYYLINTENSMWWHPIHRGYKIVKDQEELKQFVKHVIEFFNKADLSKVNNTDIYSKNGEVKRFEKKLIYNIKHRL